jgi:hypothetical protein
MSWMRPAGGKPRVITLGPSRTSNNLTSTLARAGFHAAPTRSALEVCGRRGPVRKQVDPAAAAVLLVEDPHLPEEAGDRGDGGRHVVGVLSKLGGRAAEVELDLEVDFV